MRSWLIYLNRLRLKSIGRLLPRKRLRIVGSSEEFFDQLHKQQVDYVALRWFEDLPEVKANDDIDMLVSDESYVITKALLQRSRRGVAVDLYSVGGGEGSYKNLGPYYEPTFANKILENKTSNEQGVSVPDEKYHFLSLAYHALYHKGLKSGIPTDSGLSPLSRPAHDFTEILRVMAHQQSIDIEITMESLDAYLQKNGVAPSKELRAALATKNPWLKDQDEQK